MQFFVQDYLVDTAPMTLTAQGAWMRILCALHASDTRGTKAMPVDAWARYLGVTAEVTEAVIAEIEALHIGNVEHDGNGDVTLTCRRMLGEELTREQTRLRVARHRDKTLQPEGRKNGNGAVTGKRRGGNADVTGKKSEVISQKSEVPNLHIGAIAPPPAPPPLSEPGTPPLPLLLEGEDQPPPDPVFLRFPIIDSPTEWELHESKLAEYRETFRGVAAEAALREARQWCIDNPGNRKTARGMPAFLFRWLEKRQNHSRTGERRTSSIDSRFRIIPS